MPGKVNGKSFRGRPKQRLIDMVEMDLGKCAQRSKTRRTAKTGKSYVKQ